VAGAESGRTVVTLFHGDGSAVSRATDNFFPQATPKTFRQCALMGWLAWMAADDAQLDMNGSRRPGCGARL